MDRPNNKRQTYRQTVEVPIELKVQGMSGAVHAMLLDISAEGARVRSLISLEKNAALRFEFKRGEKTLDLKGRIAAVKRPPGQGSYEYGIAFDKISTADADWLIAEIMELQRRAALARTESREPAQTAATGAQRRGAFRAVITFKVKYRRDGRPGSNWAKASDLSAGGLRLMTNEPIPNDSLLTLEFTLPEEVLSVFPDAVKETEETPWGPREVKKASPRKPFEQMAVRARVASRLKDSQGQVVLGIQFMEVDPYTREEISRFIHALQLYRMRMSIDNL